MIEMQWVKAPLNTSDNVVVFPAGNQINWLHHKLQFREVVELTKDGLLTTATEWQDVKIGEST